MNFEANSVILSDKYPNIIFNDDISKRNKHNILLCLEINLFNANNYDLEIMSKYGGIITWNSKVYEAYKKALKNIKLVKGFLCNRDRQLDNFIPVENKINGITLICRYRLDSRIGSITNNRYSVMNYLVENSKLVCHTYGKWKYGGDLYQGVIGDTEKETYPSSISKLKKLNEYKYNLCFENCYDVLWSWDYITEKIFDCFKAKTVPIYWGCYNVKEIIPKELYIDYRDFQNNADLVRFLTTLDDKKYKQMIEDAYEFEKTFVWGNTEEYERIFKEMLNGNNK